MNNKTNTNLTYRGNKLAVLGSPIQEGAKAPAFKLTGNDLQDVQNSQFNGKVLVLSVVPSLDTPTCALQTKRFNQEAGKFSKDVTVLTVSMDLPFAQMRWCGNEDAKNIATASDYKYHTFGEAYGCYLPDTGLLGRAVFVVDKGGVVRYVDYVKELSSEPDYDPVLAKVQELAS